MAWITRAQGETNSHDELFEDLFGAAKTGLRDRGFAESTATASLQPLRYRATHQQPPADWKLDRVRQAVENGADFESAVYRAQRRYFDRQQRTLFDGSFVDWPTIM